MESFLTILLVFIDFGLYFSIWQVDFEKWSAGSKG